MLVQLIVLRHHPIPFAINMTLQDEPPALDEQLKTMRSRSTPRRSGAVSINVIPRLPQSGLEFSDDH